MNINTLLAVLATAMLLDLNVSAQDDFLFYSYHEGHIIHNNGTKERGLLQYLPEEERYQKVIFKKNDDAKKQKFKVTQLSGYTLAEKDFKAMEYDDILGKGRKFLIIDTIDCISSYHYTAQDDEGTWNVINVYDNGERAVNCQKLALGFSKKMAEFLAADEELSKKVADKERGYGLINLHKVIAEYNQRCKKRE